MFEKKKFWTNNRFRKQNIGHDKIRKRFASGNVIIMYMTPLLFWRNRPFMSKET